MAASFDGTPAPTLLAAGTRAPTTEFARWWTEVLTLHPRGADRFEAAPAPSAFPRLYGGQVAAQCLLAAAWTVRPAREPHSVQVTYLRGGDNSRPVSYRVEHVRESRTLSTRLVRAEQGDRLLATATASFHHPPPAGARYALEHDARDADHPSQQDPPPPDPATLPSRPELLAAAFGDQIPATAAAVWPVDVRYVDRAPWEATGTSGPRNRQWFRAASALPDVPARNAVALTFATDYPMFEPVLFPHALPWDQVISGHNVYGASLDHALWFHRPARSDDWLLLEQLSPVASGGRGLCRAEVRSPSGALVATVVQEIALVDPAATTTA
ncbi:MAG TPA: acyl-CoA thioesterase domain-containing protein [Pseudonocardia sp.]|uniref:acyl-CoA thioesterase n=1 Tax=Pseudonocardia sp. TaxID=60912 RepID=UPI002D001A6F|nr:acyl-CoA thioesterase domain-containing protein [Pseudonocardia sp.]HTF46217.1 acyl-CoA thioesterase domain-containing protein [Pseudonocardia sp.]